jgi:AcrR family transcriptional regulator
MIPVRTKSPLQAEKILAVAGRLFATHRFHEVRMEDIAAAAEVGKGTLYRYFKDKEELYEALLDRAAVQLAQRVRDGTAQGSPRQKLEAVVAAIVAYFDENPHLFDLIHHAEVRRRPDREFLWQHTRDEITRLVHRTLDEGQAGGAFTVRDRDLATLLLLGGLRSVIRFDRTPRGPDLPARIIDLFLDGAATSAAAPPVPRGRRPAAV